MERGREIERGRGRERWRGRERDGEGEREKERGRKGEREGGKEEASGPGVADEAPSSPLLPLPHTHTFVPPSVPTCALSLV